MESNLSPDFVFRLLDQASDALLVVSAASRRVEWCNRGAAAALGRTRNELAQLTYDTVDPSLEDAAAWDAWKAELVGNPRTRRETVYRTTSGQGFHVEESAELMPVGGASYVLVVARDIRERKRMEQALWDGTEKLRALVDRRESELREIWRAIAPETPPDDLDVGRIVRRAEASTSGKHVAARRTAAGQTKPLSALKETGPIAPVPAARSPRQRTEPGSTPSATASGSLPDPSKRPVD